MANADLCEISTWARLSGSQLRQPLLAFLSVDVNGQTSSSLTTAAEVDASMERLVRLLSASKELDVQTLQSVETLRASHHSSSGSFTIVHRLTNVARS